MAKTAAQAEDEDVVAELARQIVRDRAPQELVLFNPTAAAYFEDPQRSLERARAKDQKLGFGVVEAAAFITPYVLEVAKAVFQYLLEQLATAAEQEAASSIVKRLSRVLHRKASEDEGLTQEQLERVRDVALTKAQQLRLPEDQAELLAASVVGALALS